MSKRCRKIRRKSLYNEKGSTQEAVAILSIYIPDTGVPTYIKQTDLKGEIDFKIIMTGDFTTSLSLEQIIQTKKNPTNT
jgi:hypothetical protein